jgi:hypothetical protein
VNYANDMPVPASAGATVVRCAVTRSGYAAVVTDWQPELLGSCLGPEVPP